MRKRQPKKDFTKVEENEEILKARQELLQSAEEEKRRLETLEFLQKETQERIDKLAAEEKHAETRIAALTTRKEQLEALERKLVGEQNTLSTEVTRLTSEKNKLEADVDEAGAVLTNKRDEIARIEDKLREVAGRLAETTEEKMAEQAKVQSLRDEYVKVRTVYDSLIAERTKKEAEWDAFNEAKAALILSYEKQEKELQNKIALARETLVLSEGVIQERNKEIETLRNTTASLEKKIAEQKAHIEEEQKKLDVRSETMAALAEELRIEANKYKAKDLDKRIASFLKEK